MYFKMFVAFCFVVCYLVIMKEQRKILEQEAVIFRLPPLVKRELQAKLKLEGQTIQQKFSEYSYSLIEEKTKETA